MIEVLIEDRLTDWVYASNYDGLEFVLRNGWKGYDNYTNDELKAEIKNMRIEQEDINELLESSKYRKSEDRQRENEMVKGEPFED